MKVAFLTRRHFLDGAMVYAKGTSKLCDFHFLVEVTDRKAESIVDSIGNGLSSGVHVGDESFSSFFPRSIISDYLRNVTSMSIAYYRLKSRLGVVPIGSVLRVNNSLIRFIEALSPDIVHLDDISVLSSLTLARLRSRLPRLPIVLTIHDPIPHEGEYNWRIAALQRIAVHHASRIIFRSAVDPDPFCRLHHLDRSKISVVPLGAFSLFRDWLIPHEVTVNHESDVLFFGRISKYKGLETLSAAIPIVLAKRPNTRFVIAGREIGDYRIPETLRQFSERGRITLITRYLKISEVAALLRGTSIVVAPYSSATQSGVVMTAFAFKKPVVATNVGGISEAVESGKTGILIPPRDPESLANAILGLLQNQDARDEISKNIELELENRLSSEAVGRQMKRVYEEVLLSGSARR